jgi:hypothetical protein
MLSAAYNTIAIIRMTISNENDIIDNDKKLLNYIFIEAYTFIANTE